MHRIIHNTIDMRLMVRYDVNSQLLHGKRHKQRQQVAPGASPEVHTSKLLPEPEALTGGRLSSKPPTIKQNKKAKNMRYIAVKTSSTHYKFINITKVKQQAEEVGTVVLLFAVIWLMMFI